VILVGSRRVQSSSATETAVPVDFIPMTKLAETGGQFDLAQTLTYLSPSFNSTRQTGAAMNAIPMLAVKNIQVLRDGAAAQYGSDAIAGVINIELKKSLGFGGSHIFNVKPTTLDENETDNGFKYESVQFGLNGAAYFARLWHKFQAARRQKTRRGAFFVVRGTAYFMRMSFLTDFTPRMPRATLPAAAMSCCWATKPLS